MRVPLASFTARRRAFTLVELLVVIAVIAILCALIFPAMGAMQRSADMAKCSSNLRMISAAFRNYAQANNGYYPSPRAPQTGGVYTDPNSTGGPWQMEIAEYTTGPLVAKNVYRLKEVPPNANVQYCPTYVRFFRGSVKAMQDTGLNALGYGMNINMNVNGQDINFGGRINERFKEVGIVRPEAAILIGDSADYHLDCSGVGWKTIPPTTRNPDGYSSGAPKRHGGKANYLYADGHVEALTPDEALPQLKFNSFQ
jgi:prepilin-type processing-associated H-X9-DG protein/prepilin-type N-terminal cleavage/methylation domain-containing protein